MSVNILVVDDSEFERKLIHHALLQAGHVVIEAVNGMDALEKLATNDIGLVFTDLNMPKMDGFELIRNIRQDDNYRRLPVIILSSESGERDKDLGIKTGADLFLVKPVSSTTLVDTVEKLLKKIAGSC